MADAENLGRTLIPFHAYGETLVARGVNRPECRIQHRDGTVMPSVVNEVESVVGLCGELALFRIS
jgi:hypothetical protein